MDNIMLKVLELVIIIAITVIMRYAVPYIKQKIGAEKLEAAAIWAQQAVEAAEQIIREPGSGAEKKEIVTKFLSELLMSKNIALTYDELNTLIEAAVFAMKQEMK